MCVLSVSQGCSCSCPQPLEEAGEWEAVGGKLAAAAKTLENAGCAGAIICCNSVHQAYDAAQAAVSIPILHISEVAADEILRRGLKTVALFGTRFTADAASYFTARLEQKGLQEQSHTIGSTRCTPVRTATEPCMHIAAVKHMLQ